MDKLLSLLTGKKTYVIAALMALTVFALNVGWIDKGTHDNIVGILTAAGLATLRAGVSAGVGK